MNSKQKAFAEHYAACGNAAEAARQAGYSEKTARSQGQRLLTDVDIWRYIREIQERAADKRIASIKQVKAYWSDVLNNPQERTADRLRAGELLAKSSGAFLHYALEDDTAIAGQYDGEDVIIYLPENGRDNESN